MPTHCQLSRSVWPCPYFRESIVAWKTEVVSFLVHLSVAALCASEKGSCFRSKSTMKYATSGNFSPLSTSTNLIFFSMCTPLFSLSPLALSLYDFLHYHHGSQAMPLRTW